MEDNSLADRATDGSITDFGDWFTWLAHASQPEEYISSLGCFQTPRKYLRTLPGTVIDQYNAFSALVRALHEHVQGRSQELAETLDADYREEGSARQAMMELLWMLLAGSGLILYDIDRELIVVFPRLGPCATVDDFERVVRYSGMGVHLPRFPLLGDLYDTYWRKLRNLDLAYAERELQRRHSAHPEEFSLEQMNAQMEKRRSHGPRECARLFKELIDKDLERSVTNRAALSAIWKEGVSERYRDIEVELSQLIKLCEELRFRIHFREQINRYVEARKNVSDAGPFPVSAVSGWKSQASRDATPTQESYLQEARLGQIRKVDLESTDDDQDATSDSETTAPQWSDAEDHE